MKRKIMCLFLLALLIGTIMPYASGAADKEVEKNKEIISNNSPPSEPIINAPDSAKRGDWFNVQFSAEDPNGDEIYYRYQFDVDTVPSIWYGPFKSGTERDLLVKVVPVTTITIKAQAKDIHGAESKWSSVDIPVSKNKNCFQQFFRILQAFPNIFSILKTLKSL